MKNFCLLNKTELIIQGIDLENADLNEISTVMGRVLGVDRSAILVTDFQSDTLVLDILEENIDTQVFLSENQHFLKSLSAIPGVRITSNASIESRGMLGWINLDQEIKKEVLKSSESIGDEINKNLSKRVIVFSTGFEVAGGKVKDTNTPTISHRLKKEGYLVTEGPTLKDDEVLIAANLRQAAENGYSLIIITGGVGAEAKDHTIEAVLALDADAAAPYTCKYQKGIGRHHKDGVRIAVGEALGTRIIALPGPNDEVKLSLEVFVKGLKSNLTKQALAGEIANTLRKKLQRTINNHLTP